MTKAPTDAQVREYVTGHFDASEAVERYTFRGIAPSPEGPHCRDARIWLEYTDGTAELVTVTVFYNDCGDIEGDY